MSESTESSFDVVTTPTAGQRGGQPPPPPPGARTTTTATTATTTATTATSTSSTTASLPKTTAPINGGVEICGAERIAWTGGSRTTPITVPASSRAYRPTEYKSKRKCEEDCSSGIGDKFELKTPDEIIKDADAVLFVDWIDQLQMFMEDTGQDGVFYLTKGRKEINLLTDFGALDVEETTAAVNSIKRLGCTYDATNLKTSGIAVRASLSTSMLQRIKGMVPVNASGPETLAAVVAAHQILDTTGCRILTEELLKLKLSEFPAENVDQFRLKVLEKGRRIEGCLLPLPDLPALIAKCFRGSQSVDFNMEVATWYKKATRRRVTDWREIVSDLTLTYKTLYTNGEWPAATNRKEDVAKTIQGLFSKMENKLDSKIENKIVNKLQQSSMRGRGNGGNGGNNGNGGGTQSETRSCHHCGKVGHIKPNCPELKKAPSSDSGGSKTQSATTSTLPGKKRYEAPGDNEPHTKKLGADTWKWCGKCKRWNKGDSAHLTDEHRAKETSATASTTSSRLAVAHGGGILRQSTMGFLARAGRCVNTNDLTWCSSCDRWVHSLENHSSTFEHCHGCGIRLLQQTTRKLSETIQSKDQAGQR